MPFSAVFGSIPLCSSSASGRTALSAFHNALCATNLDGYNVVRLSSVIPPGTTVDASGRLPVPAGSHGERMYCVYAERRETTAGEQAWAGMGWVQRRDGAGGFFVEHDGRDKGTVEEAIQASLVDMVTGAEHLYAPPEWVLQGTVCTGEPVCALVIAPYESVLWNGVPCD
jgi:arginine decarboxylase